jgi:hypothetical protein
MASPLPACVCGSHSPQPFRRRLEVRAMRTLRGDSARHAEETNPAGRSRDRQAAERAAWRGRVLGDPRKPARAGRRKRRPGTHRGTGGAGCGRGPAARAGRRKRRPGTRRGTGGAGCGRGAGGAEPGARGVRPGAGGAEPGARGATGGRRRGTGGAGCRRGGLTHYAQGCRVVPCTLLDGCGCRGAGRPAGALRARCKRLMAGCIVAGADHQC